jgi:hypothetical protein
MIDFGRPNGSEPSQFCSKMLRLILHCNKVIAADQSAAKGGAGRARTSCLPFLRQPDK